LPFGGAFLPFGGTTGLPFTVIVGFGFGFNRGFLGNSLTFFPPKSAAPEPPDDPRGLFLDLDLGKYLPKKSRTALILYSFTFMNPGRRDTALNSPTSNLLPTCYKTYEKIK
tara:strand:- start:7053 stop:7385 length:333 start_codon:yes stop_codon:yes gene_type:complete